MGFVVEGDRGVLAELDGKRDAHVPVVAAGMGGGGARGKLPAFGNVESCMSLLNMVPAISPRFTSEDGLAYTQGARYRRQLDEGRTSYAALVEAWGIPIARGDWGGFLPEDVECLRPGIKISTKRQREEYLVRYVHGGDGEVVEFQFYSRSYLPLFRVPVGA